MYNWATKAIRQTYQMELYEWMSLLVAAIAVTIFLVFPSRISRVMGVSSYALPLINNIVGLFNQPLAWVFTAALAILVTLVVCFRKAKHPFLRTSTYVLRILIAFCIMLGAYEAVNFYIVVFDLQDQDVVLQTIDKAIFFGKLPSEWMQSIISRPLTDILSSAYMSWFALTYVTILLMMSHSRRATIEYVCTVLSTFYIGYFSYALVPAVGPIYTVTYSHTIGGIAGSFVASKGLLAHDCFPSLHTGIAIVMLTFVWRYRRKWVWLYGPMAALIVFSTLYLRFHYAIDVIAGFSLAYVMTQTAPMWVAAWERLRAKSRALELGHLQKTQTDREAMSELA
jgi:membrane-associated phospholipid phosphatase